MGTSKEAQLRESLDKVAKQMAEMYGNPASWLTWMVYLFQKLESQAAVNPANKSVFKDMIESLRESIQNRLDTGGW